MIIKPVAISKTLVMQIKDVSGMVISSNLVSEKELKKIWLSWSKK